MSVPYRYVRGVAIGKDDTCALCGTRSTALIIEHCHEHGLTRGLTCQSCNSKLPRLDSGRVQPTAVEVFYLENCTACRRSGRWARTETREVHAASIAASIALSLKLTPGQAAALAAEVLSDASVEPEPSPVQVTAKPAAVSGAAAESRLSEDELFDLLKTWIGDELDGARPGITRTKQYFSIGTAKASRLLSRYDDEIAA